MPDAQTQVGQRSPARRTIVKGAAWAVPAVTFASAAPAMAASPDPGINGWVLNTPRWQGGCSYTLEVDSTVPGNDTPDGAPYGLYIYDTSPTDTIVQARLVYWIIGNQSATWTNLSGHSTCWSYQGRGSLQTKADGFQYRPYTWVYNCTIDPTQVSPDGRLYLGNFHVRATFTQPNNRCNDVTYWTQRFVTINGEVHTFERRNGTRGTYPSGNGFVAPQGGVDVEALKAQITEVDARLMEIETQMESVDVAASNLPGDDAESTAQPGESYETAPDIAALDAERTALIAERESLKAAKSAAEDAPAALPSLRS